MIRADKYREALSLLKTLSVDERTAVALALEQFPAAEEHRGRGRPLGAKTRNRNPKDPPSTQGQP